MTKELVLTVIVRKEAERYASWCSELDIASQGDTIEEARKNLKEAVELYIETLISDGKVSELLERLGLSEENIQNKKVLLSETFSSSFEVPLEV